MLKFRNLAATTDIARCFIHINSRITGDYDSFEEIPWDEVLVSRVKTERFIDAVKNLIKDFIN